MPRTGFYGWKNVALLFLVYMGAFGVVFYGFSVIFPAMIRELGWSRGEASVAHTVFGLLTALIVPLVARSIERIGAKGTLLVGLSIGFACLTLLGTVPLRLWSWLLIWGLIMPIGFAFSTVLPMQVTVMSWFRLRRATALGIVLTGGAIGGFLVQPLFTWLIQRTGSYRAGWLAEAGMVLAVLAAGLFVKDRPSDIGQHPDGRPPQNPAAARRRTEAPAPREPGGAIHRTQVTWTVRQVFRAPAFWYLLVMEIAFRQSVLLVSSHGILHFMDKALSPMQAAVTLSLFVAGSGIARLPMGLLADFLEPKRIAAACMSMLLIGFVGLWTTGVPALHFVLAPVAGFCFGALWVVLPVIRGNYFGSEVYHRLFSFTAPVSGLFIYPVPVVAGIVADRTGSYRTAFVAVASFLAASSVLAFLLKPPVRARSAATGSTI